MNLAKKYVIQAGEPISRRRLEELFMEMAQRFSLLHPQAIGDWQFGRADFHADTFAEYEVVKETGLQFDVPTTGRMVPSTLRVGATRDPAWTICGQWSLEGEVLASQGYLCLAVPVVNQELVWGGQDFVCADQILMTTLGSTPDDTDAAANVSMSTNPSFTLGGEFQVRGGTSSTSVGILLMSIAEFRISKTYLTMQRSPL